MNSQQAVQVLIQVAQLAQSKGILSLEDASVVLQAITALTPKEEQPTVEQEEVTTEKIK